VRKKIIVLIVNAVIFSSCGEKESAPPASSPSSSATGVSESAPTVAEPTGISLPYANDLGPKTVEVSTLSVTAQKGYRLMLQKCTLCHTSARPLNAQYLDVDSATVDRLKKSRPELFVNRYLLQIEEGVWKRKIKQMAGKSGAKISNEDAKTIYAFLLEYYQDKIGKNAEKADQWIAHRKKLLEQFKKEYPERYQLLYGSQ
jgi:mono/diheme cytochrome c family protein